MPDAYVVKAVTDEYPSQPIPGVFEELVAGRARIGWSYQDTLDLRLLLRKLEGGGELDDHEQHARRCLGFLTRVNVDDYLLYPHQPKRGTFTVVQVTGCYDYSEPQDSLDMDFRSFRPCRLTTPDPVDMYDEIVSSQLRHRLGRPGRFSQVYDTAPVFLFLDALPFEDSVKMARLRRAYKGYTKRFARHSRMRCAESFLGWICPGASVQTSLSAWVTCPRYRRVPVKLDRML